jgi:catalase
MAACDLVGARRTSLGDQCFGAMRSDPVLLHVSWPKDRPEVEFGVLELISVAPNNDDEQRHIIFDPIPRVDGIEPSDDPLLQPRATVYLASGRRRRSTGREL